MANDNMGYAENETLHSLTCADCGAQLVRKYIGALENTADRLGWVISDGKIKTQCGNCVEGDNDAS